MSKNQTIKTKQRIAAGTLLLSVSLAIPVQAQTSTKTENPSPTTSGVSLTLADAIAIALQRQPSLRQATGSLAATAARLRQNQSGYYPSLTPQYAYTRQTTDTPGTVLNTNTVGGVTTTMPTTSSGERTTENRSGSVGVSYQVFDSGTRELNNRQARQSLRADTYALEDTRQTVIVNVATYYYSVLRNLALVKVNTAQVARAQNTLDVTRAQVAAGVAARKETYQAQADLLNAQVSLTQAQSNYRIALAQLKNALGVSDTGAGTTLDELVLTDVPAPTNADTIPGTPTGSSKGNAEIGTSDDVTELRRLQSEAARDRPDLKQAKQNVEVTGTSVRLAQVNAGVSASGSLSGAYVFEPYTGNNRTVSLSLSYPLFDGGLVRSRVREARANVETSKAQQETQQQSASVAVEQAYRTLQQARTALPAAVAAQEAAQINYDAAIASRRVGVGTLVDVITAQTTLVQAQINYVNALYDYYSADASLARAVGHADRLLATDTAVPDAAGR